MLNDSVLLELTDHLYEGCVVSEWSRFIDELSRALASPMVGLQRFDHRAGRAELSHSLGCDERAARAYGEHYGTKNLWKTRRSAQPGIPGEVLVGSDVVPDSELLGTEFYEDWLRPQGDLRWSVGAVLERHDGEVATVSMVRGGPAGDYDRVERAFLERLIPHIRRARRLEDQLSALRAKCDASLHALDLIETAILLVTGLGDVVHANLAARRRLDAKAGLRLQGGRLAATHATDTTRLQAALKAASGGAPRDVHSLSLPSGYSQPLGVLVTPLPVFLGRQGCASVCVFVSDANVAPRLSEHQMRRIFSLTQAEARLAAALHQGLDLADAAGGLGIALSTARTHLKRLFEKTGTRRQAELVLLLARIGGMPAP